MHIIGHSAILVAPFGQISTASYIQSLFILAKYRHIVSDPNGRVPKSSTYHNNNYAQFLRRRFSAFQFLPRTAIMINRV